MIHDLEYSLEYILKIMPSGCATSPPSLEELVAMETNIPITCNHPSWRQDHHPFIHHWHTVQQEECSHAKEFGTKA